MILRPLKRRHSVYLHILTLNWNTSSRAIAPTTMSSASIAEM
jgi:hypothetical protein